MSLSPSGSTSGAWHALHYWLAHVRLAILTALQYRAGFFSEGILGVGWSLLGLAPLLVALEYRPEIAGWDRPALWILTGVYCVVAGLNGALIQPAVMRAMEDIRTGAFDYALLRPMPALVVVFGQNLQMWRLCEVICGLALIVAGRLAIARDFTWWEIPGGLGLLGASLLIQLALAVMMVGVSFRALRLENLTFLLDSVLDLGRWPIDVFRGPARAFFAFVIPLGVMITFPAAWFAFGNRVEIWLGALTVSALFMACSAAVYRRGLANYTSASS